MGEMMSRINIGLTLSCFLFLSACSTFASNTNLSVRKSLPTGFQSRGVATANVSDGAPVRTGNSSFRFEVRDGDCSRDEGWNDCKNDRQRHEYTSDDVTGEVWFNWSLYIPSDFESIFPATVTLS
jgi:hypothetical protein